MYLRAVFRSTPAWSALSDIFCVWAYFRSNRPYCLRLIIVRDARCHRHTPDDARPGRDKFPGYRRGILIVVSGKNNCRCTRLYVSCSGLPVVIHFYYEQFVKYNARDSNRGLRDQCLYHSRWGNIAERWYAAGTQSFSALLRCPGGINEPPRRNAGVKSSLTVVVLHV